MAKKIHELSFRRACPFVAINCANLTEGLLESELFGHTKGAFTGAVCETSGLLEIAGKGTVFLDEIGELSLPLQAKILRLMDNRESRKIGATKTTIVYARFLFATNRDLRGDIEVGTFRKDLFYRVNVVRIMLPALKERKEDIPDLIRHFLEREYLRNGVKKAITPEAIEKLTAYDFPGNVRELENVIERASVLSEGPLIAAEDIRIDSEEQGPRQELARKNLIRTLEMCQWNKTRTAMALGKSRRQLYRLLDKLQVDGSLRKLVI